MVPSYIKHSIITVSKNKNIIDGYQNDCLFFLEKGIADVMYYGDNGEEMRIYRYFPGSFFGEVETFSDNYLPFPVVAIEECVLIKIQKQEVLKWIKQDPEISLKIINGMCQKLMDGTNGKYQLQYMTGKQRYLKSMKEHTEKNDLALLTKHQLSQEICLPIRSLNRIIAQCTDKYYYKNKKFYKVD